MTSLPLPLLLLLAAIAPSALPVQGGFGQVTIRERVIVRVPRMERSEAVGFTAAPIRWVEKKKLKCVPLRSIIGASVMDTDHLDFIVDTVGRVRAKFENSCGALDFYKGFYMRGTADDQVCAGRDSIRSRSGEECRIRSLRMLVARR